MTNEVIFKVSEKGELQDLNDLLALQGWILSQAMNIADDQNAAEEALSIYETATDRKYERVSQEDAKKYLTMDEPRLEIYGLLSIDREDYSCYAGVYPEPDTQEV